MSLDPPLVLLEQVSRTYSLGSVEVLALREASLSIRRGELVAIMGPSGSGKSTLLNLLGTLDRPSAGRYLLDGEAVETLDDDQLAQLRNEKLGFVFQSFHLLAQENAQENVELPLLYARISRGERRARALEALERVGLRERAHHRPNQLSGGQQQRVAIARAIVNRPLLLLADEPTGALDSETSREVMELLLELHRQGMTVVIVTHDSKVASYAERVIVVEDGRIARDARRVSEPVIVETGFALAWEASA
jgi:putative ABC transport system ATP-binding protein